MALIKFYKVNTLPGVLEGDAFYYVSNGEVAESYLTNSAGIAKSVGNTAMINKLIQEALESLAVQGNAVEIAPNIASRDAMIVDATTNLLILVVDASADPTVNAGSALYAFSFSAQTTYKVAEYESMDVVLQWSNIVGRPTSTVAQIDSAVSQAHAHTNKAVIDRLSDVEGQLQYNGAPLTTNWTTQNW